MAEEHHGADDADTLLPDGAALAGKGVERRGVVSEVPGAEDFVAGEVDEVPVVHRRKVVEVEVNAPLLFGGVFLGVVKTLYQDQQTRQPHFVPLRCQTLLKVVPTALFPVFLHHRAGDGHLDAKKTVALAVLSRSRLEKPRQIYRLRSICLHNNTLHQFVHSILLFTVFQLQRYTIISTCTKKRAE